MTSAHGLGAIPDADPVTTLLARIARDIGVLVGMSSALASANIALAGQSSMQTERPTLLALTEALTASQRGFISDEQLRNTLGRYGFSDDAQGALFKLREQLLGAGELVELQRRGSIDSDTYARGLGALGYSAESAARLTELGLYIPTAQDVVQFAVREVYTPEISEKYGQFQDFPKNALDDFKRAGLTQEQASKYWAAHWQLPSIEMAMHMYHRRAETGFQLDDVLQLMRAGDVMPYYRDKMLAIASVPYTRVDVRRMHKLGILDLTQVAQAYQAIGYNDERARNMATFTEKLNSKESDDELEPFRAGLRGRVLSMYQARNLPAAHARTVLDDLGYKPEQVTAYMTEAEFIRNATMYDDWRAAIRKLYVDKHWTRAQAIKRMLALGFDEGELVDLFPLWDVDRELREATAADHHEKDLTKTEIIGAYTDALADEVTTREHLHALGYDDAEIEVLVRRADHAKAKAKRSEGESNLHTLYVAGKKSQAETRSALAGLGGTAEHVDALMVKWDAELDSKSPELTVAQVEQALKKGIIDEDDARRRLEHIGYAADERDIIVALAYSTGI